MEESNTKRKSIDEQIDNIMSDLDKEDTNVVSEIKESIPKIQFISDYYKNTSRLDDIDDADSLKRDILDLSGTLNISIKIIDKLVSIVETRGHLIKTIHGFSRTNEKLFDMTDQVRIKTIKMLVKYIEDNMSEEELASIDIPKFEENEYEES